MYLEHFGLNEPPFRITPHTDFFFGGANRGATLEALLYAITNDEGIVKVSGEVGSGKTMLCRVLMERLPKNVETIYLANPSLSRDEILFEIAEELQLDTGAGRPSRLLRALQEHLIALYSQGRRVVVLIDEAHAMPRETLEEIRLLSNLEANRHKLLQIVLFGQPELDLHLDTGDMRQLKERITHTFRLEPLVRRDVEGYIEFRMRAAGYRGPSVFSGRAVRRIAKASEGLTRRINILADKSLLAAFAANAHAVTDREVKRAIRDSDFHRFRPNARAAWLAAGGLAAGILLTVALGWVLPQPFFGTAQPVQGAAVRAAGPVTKADQSPGAPAPAAPPADAAGAADPATPGPTPVAAAAMETPMASPPAGASPPAQAAGPKLPAAAPPAAAGGVGAAARAEPPGDEPRAPARGRLLKERFAATQEWLRTAPANHYSIQLMTAKESEVSRLENFLARASNLLARDDLHVYSVKIDGVQNYRVAYGLYGSVAETLAAIRELPPALNAHAPYHRSVARMRSQNRQ